MKKILVTTLALSLACASMVDARRMGAAPAAKAADVLGAAKNLVDAKKEQMPIEQPAQDVVAELTNPNMTKEQKELVAKRAERAELEKLIRLKKDEISDIGYGWFGFGTSEEQKSEHRKAKADLVNLGTKLKDVNARIRELETITGKKWSKAVNAGLGALALVGIVAIAYGVDRVTFKGAGMEFLSDQASGAYEAVGNRFTAMGESFSDWRYSTQGARQELNKSKDDLAKLQADLAKNPNNKALQAQVKEAQDNVAALQAEIFQAQGGVESAPQGS